VHEGLGRLREEEIRIVRDASLVDLLGAVLLRVTL
jgi:hypothetical protein